MKIFTDKDLVNKITPVFAVFMLEAANIGQILRMWTERTADGQSLASWIAVWLALLAWLNLYRVNELRWAFWATVVGVGLNTCVWLTVIWFRWVV